MKIQQILDSIYKHVLRSKLSKSFMAISIVSLVLSLINKTHPFLLIIELFIYISLATTTNCFLYGNCQLSAVLILLVPFSLILINIFEIIGFGKVKEIQSKELETIKELSDPSFLKKTDKEKEEQINKLKNIIKESKIKYINE